MTAIEGRVASHAANSGCLAVGQEVNDPASLEIADDRAVPMPALECPVIDTDHARSLNRPRNMASNNA